jgi:hypothetical protein
VSGEAAFAPPARDYGGEAALTALEPPWRELPNRDFSDEFLELRARIYEWIEPYYDRDHLTRAGDWMLVLDPDVPEPLIVAALLHDMERSVPGGPALDKARTPWDDRDYNRAHCERSAVIVPKWLQGQGASAAFVEGVAQPIREHEFGGSAEGDLMQAADSISFLETNSALVAGWASSGECSLEKACEKLRWMGARVRHERGAELALTYCKWSLAELERLLGNEHGQHQH